MTAKKAEKLIRGKVEAPGPLIEPPADFTAEQKADWNYAIENAPRDVLKRIDKAILAGFIFAQDVHRKAAERLQQTELLVKSPVQNIPVQNPYLAIVNRQFLLMMRAAAELGFTPCSRARLEAASPQREQSSDWDEISG